MCRCKETPLAEQQNKIPNAAEGDYIREIKRMVSEMENKERLIGIYTFVRRLHIYEMEERAKGSR